MPETTELDTSTPEVSETVVDPNTPTFGVKIDGEEHQVTMGELQSGYQRQSDYTRKTQELARERERLAQGEAIVQALESDPQGAVTALADAFGVGVTGNPNGTTDYMVEDVDVDPDEVRLRRIESSIEDQNRAWRQQNLQGEIINLQDKFQTPIDQANLFAHALKHNIGNLEAAYTHMTYGDMQKKAQNADIVDEKRAATIVDSTSGSTSGNVERAPSAVQSIRDAYMLAREQT